MASLIRREFWGRHAQRIQRLMRTTLRTEPVGKALEVLFLDRIENGYHSLLNNLVLQCRDAQRRCFPSAFGISTLLEGCARYAPRWIRRMELDNPILQPVSYSCHVTPSTPAKPDAEVRRSYRAVMRRSNGGAER